MLESAVDVSYMYKQDTIPAMLESAVDVSYKQDAIPYPNAQTICLLSIHVPHHSGSTMHHVLPVVVTVGTEVHAAGDPGERPLLATAQPALLPCSLSGHLVGIGIWSHPLVDRTQV